MQLDEELIPVHPGMCIMIRPRIRHRAIGKMKVLIGSKHKSLTELYSKILKKEGYIPIIAEDASDVVIKARTEKDIEAIILDLCLPGSFSALNRLSNKPVLAIAGDPDVESYALSEGADYFLKRPFDNNENLVSSLKRALRNYYTENLAVA